MWSNLRELTTNLLHSSKWFIQPKRNTYILKRKYPMRLSKLGSPFSKKLKKRNFYYEVVENTDITSKPHLGLVLTADVAGIGMRGEKLEMNIYRAYRDFLLPKLAVYADSPEAQNITRVSEQKQYSSVYSKIVENHLSTTALPIFLSADTNWTLEKWHVRMALRKINIVTTDDCITIPKPISGPDFEIENKDFLIELTMNKSEKFLLRSRIYHWSTSNPFLNKKEFNVYSESKALFPEQQEQIDALIKYAKEAKKATWNRS